MLNKNSKLVLLTSFTLVLIIFCLAAYKFRTTLSVSETPNPRPESAATPATKTGNPPAQGSNTILAIYELEDRIVFLAQDLTSASLLSWNGPGRQTEHFLSYGQLFTSSDHGETISKNTKYQIKLDNENDPTLSEVYYFQGNRAVIDYLPCPYENYIHNECTLEVQETNADATAAKKLARDAQRKSDLKEIQTAVESYYKDRGSYPATLAEIAAAMPDDLPRDPLTHEYYRYTTPDSSAQTYRLCVPKKNIESQPDIAADYCLGNSR